MFGWLRKRSYADVKRELQVRDELYSRMSSLSDAQMEKWVQTRVGLENMRHNHSTVHAITSVSTDGEAEND